MPRGARPWHALSVSATLDPCHRPRKGIDTVAFERQPPCLVFLSLIAAPGFRDELKGSGLGLGLTPRTHPIGMLALSAVHVRTSLHLVHAVPYYAELDVNPHTAKSLSQRSPGARQSTIRRTRRGELKGVVDA